MSTRHAALDNARGLAILGVIAVHVSQHFASGLEAVQRLLWAGQFGVQLFFAVSAFTMCLTLEGRGGTSDRPFQDFLIRRFCRLAVPLWAAMLVYLGLRAVGDPHFASGDASAGVLAATGALVNGVWPRAFSAVVPGGGSIATEAVFYALFPLLWPLRHRCAALALLAAGSVVVDQWAYRPAVHALASALPGWAGTPEDLRQFLHYGIVKQLPVFLAGMAVFGLMHGGKRTPWRDLAAGAAAVGVMAWGSGYLAGIAVVAGGLLWLFCRHDAPLPLLGWLGQRSYSLYLFHFAVIDLALALWPADLRGAGSFWGAFPWVLAVSAGLAALTRPLLEDRGTALGRWIIARRRARSALAAT